MKTSRVFALIVGAIVLTAATIAVASTPTGQVVYGPGSPVILTGATVAAPGSTVAGGVIVDTVSTLTNGKLLSIRNNGVEKASFDLNGVLAATGVTATGSTAFDYSGSSGIFKTSTGAVTIGPGAITLSGLISASVAAPGSAATTGTAASVALSAAGQAGGASSGGATNNAAGTGSNDAIISGAGGVASGAATGTNTGGNGGTLQVATGAGGAASGATTANVGGNGGAETDAGGAGGAATGAATTNTGGNGGTIANVGGVGGAASGGTTNVGGNGGASNVTGGNGGNGTQTGGNGGAVNITAGNAGTGGNANAGNVVISAGSATGSGAAGSITIGSAVSAARAGVRNGTNRYIVRNSPAVVDCAAGNLTPTVAQIVDGTIFTCATAQSITLPTAQGASGLVQNLPGTPAVGDVFQIKLAVNHATNLFTLAAGTGGTIYGIAGTTNGSRTWDCRVTAVTASSETYTCY